MWSDRVSNPGPLAHESDALQLRYGSAGHILGLSVRKVEFKVFPCPREAVVTMTDV